MAHSRFAPRIIALGMQGLTALVISQRVGCSADHAERVMRAWKEQGGDEIVREYRLAARRTAARRAANGG